jgi:hypothetical protein
VAPKEKPRAVRIDPTPERVNARVPASGISKVIEDALRAAGLIR